MLTKRWQYASRTRIGKQALLVTTTLRLLPVDHDLHRKGLQQLESLRQLAIRDNINGIRWKDIADDDDLDICTEEWVVRIAEAFEEDKSDHETVPGIIQWLLQAKHDHNWSTTKATADAISLLYRQQQLLIGYPRQWSATIGNTTQTVSNDLLKGMLFRFVDMGGNFFPDEIPVTINNAAQNAGGINYYYFTSNPPVDSGSNDIKIARSLFRYNSTSAGWEAISPSTVLRPGDRIRAELSITNPRMLQYVYIDEKRAAACEPFDAASGYEWGEGFTYYKSVRDVGFHFFAEKIPAGISVIRYETVVAKTGSFTWGPAALQCMYRPEVKAYSNSVELIIKE